MKIIRNFLLVSVLLIAFQACAPLDVPASDPNLINTAVVGTSAAAQTQTAQAQVRLMELRSPTPTVTKPIPSPTPFPTFTSVVLLPPQIRVSKNTNCRAGPGEVYDKVGVLRAGDVADVVGRSADAQWWIIRNPNKEGKVCWLSGKYASVTGVAGALPVFTPPPTPKPTRTSTPKPKPTHTPNTPAPPVTVTFTSTSSLPPDFAASYTGMENCSGTAWWVDIRLTNTGGITFQSISMTVSDTVNNIDLPLSSDDFIDRNGCSGSDTGDILLPGAAHIVSSPDFTYDPTGHQLQVTIILCPEPGQSGMCVMHGTSFTP